MHTDHSYVQKERGRERERETREGEGTRERERKERGREKREREREKKEGERQKRGREKREREREKREGEGEGEERDIFTVCNLISFSSFSFSLQLSTMTQYRRIISFSEHAPFEPRATEIQYDEVHSKNVLHTPQYMRVSSSGE